jgi:DNA-binding NtrC family response regulator
LTRALVERGWKATAVESGEAALAVLADQSFDLIFLDLMMAGMNGAQAFQEIRHRDPSAQVVIVTGYPDSEMMAAALRTGPFALLLKPFTLSDLHKLVDDRSPRER